jgi:hypothetical protein
MGQSGRSRGNRDSGKPGRCILRLLEVLEEPEPLSGSPPGDAEVRRQGATGAAADRQPEEGEADPRAPPGT